MCDSGGGFSFQLLKHLVEFCDTVSERYAIEDRTTVSNKYIADPRKCKVAVSVSRLNTRSQNDVFQ